MISAYELSPAEQRAFAMFLKMEIRRHKTDIANAEADLGRLKAMGVDIDNLPDLGFVTTEEQPLGFA